MMRKGVRLQLPKTKAGVRFIAWFAQAAGTEQDSEKTRAAGSQERSEAFSTPALD